MHNLLVAGHGGILSFFFFPWEVRYLLKASSSRAFFYFNQIPLKMFFYPHKNPYHLKPDIQITWLTFLANQLFSTDPRKQPSMDL